MTVRFGFRHDSVWPMLKDQLGSLDEDAEEKLTKVIQLSAKRTQAEEALDRGEGRLAREIAREALLTISELASGTTALAQGGGASIDCHINNFIFYGTFFDFYAIYSQITILTL